MACTLAVAMLGAVIPASGAEAATGDKCLVYYFEYTDGHTDWDEICTSQGVPAQNNLTRDAHGIHVNRLHVSCSDLYGTEVHEGDTLVGYTTDGTSDLAGHTIAVDEAGVAQWGVAKDWTGNRVDCGFIPPPPSEDDDPEVECRGGVMIEVRDADTNDIVSGASGTFTGGDVDLSDGAVDAGTFDCGTEHTATLSSAPDGYEIVDGSDTGTLSDSDGDEITLVLTVDETSVCRGGVMVEVRDADSGDLVPGAASGTFGGESIDLDSDGTTDTGTFDCGTEHTATLTSPPDGYEIVDGSDTGTLPETDGATITLVLTVDVDEVPPGDDPSEEPTDEDPTEEPTDEDASEEPTEEVLDEGLVCEGAMEIIVIGPDGEEIDGPVTLDGTAITTPHADGEVLCGEYTIVLDTEALPDDVELDEVTNSDTDGPDSGPTQTVSIEDGDDDRVVFVLADSDSPTAQPEEDTDPQVLGASLEAAAPETNDEATTEVAGEELARTGVEHVALLVTALLLLLAGAGLLRFERPVTESGGPAAGGGPGAGDAPRGPVSHGPWSSHHGREETATLQYTFQNLLLGDGGRRIGRQFADLTGRLGADPRRRWRG